MNKNFYRLNRQRLISSLPYEKCMVVLSSGYEINRSADENYEFQVNNNFYYLTGIKQPNVHLIMLKENDRHVEILYIDEYSELYEKWMGHRLTYKEIVDKLDMRYGIRPDVKSIAKNIDTLIGAGYEIEKCGYKGCYLACRDFEKGELMYLIDAINSSTAIDPKQAKDLINKLTKDYSRYDRKKYHSVMKIDLQTSKSRNKELFYVIEILSEAIEQGKKVAFHYNEYTISKELQEKFNSKD